VSFLNVFFEKKKFRIMIYQENVQNFSVVILVQLNRDLAV